MRTWWHRLHRPQAGDDAGMSLAEVLVAMFIFALVSSGLAYSMVAVLGLSREARTRAVAANLAAEEIDLARDTADLFALLDETRTVDVNGDEYTVARRTQWVSDPDADFTCGSAGGTGQLRYKRVNVTVTWGGMGAGSEPVRSDTVLNPDDHINDPTKGTILVSVLRADGTGNGGVTISASPATGSVISPTDAQGCTYVLKVNPGTYTVTAARSGHVSDTQATSGSQSVVVAAGSTASVGFQLDAQATFTATLAPGSAGVRVPTNLATTFVNTYGTFPMTASTGSGTATQTFRLHPFATGYQAYAGVCEASDPTQWPEEVVGPTTYRGVLPDAIAAPAGGAAAVSVPMGVVRVGSGGSGTYLKAVSVSGPGPGCTTTMTYTFGNVLPASGAVTIALPYGAWRLYQGNASSQTTAVPAARVTVPAPAVPERTTVGTDAGTALVTFDPRVAVTP